MLQRAEDLSKSQELSAWAEYPYMVAGSIQQSPIKTGDEIRFSESFQPEKDESTNRELGHGIYRVAASKWVSKSSEVPDAEKSLKEALEGLLCVMAIDTRLTTTAIVTYSTRIKTNASEVREKLRDEEAKRRGAHATSDEQALYGCGSATLPDNLLETAYKIYEKHFTLPLSKDAKILLMALRWYNKGLSMPELVDKFIAFFLPIDLLVSRFAPKGSLKKRFWGCTGRFKWLSLLLIDLLASRRVPKGGLKERFRRYIESFKSGEEADEIVDTFEPLKEKRDKLLHGKYIEVTPQDVEKTRSIAQMILHHKLNMEHELLE